MMNQKKCWTRCSVTWRKNTFIVKTIGIYRREIRNIQISHLELQFLPNNDGLDNKSKIRTIIQRNSGFENGLTIGCLVVAPQLMARACLSDDKASPRQFCFNSYKSRKFGIFKQYLDYYTDTG